MQPHSSTEVIQMIDFEKQKRETMRFQAAVAALQGILTDGYCRRECSVNNCARLAVGYADALLKELERE
jgi:hypothetical protein